MDADLHHLPANTNHAGNSGHGERGNKRLKRRQTAKLLRQVAPRASLGPYRQTRQKTTIVLSLSTR